ncbi:MAG: hypothetical protein ABL893_16810, partial [Hyphomicrobium sp.]
NTTRVKCGSIAPYKCPFLCGLRELPVEVAASNVFGRAEPFCDQLLASNHLDDLSALNMFDIPPVAVSNSDLGIL